MQRDVNIDTEEEEIDDDALLENFIEQFYIEFMDKFYTMMTYERFREIILISCGKIKQQRYYLAHPYWQPRR